MVATLKKPKKVDPPKEVVLDDIVKEFVGPVENLMRIDILPVFGDDYRINVWTSIVQNGRICATNRIVKSYYVSITNGILTDLTIRK